MIAVSGCERCDQLMLCSSLASVFIRRWPEGTRGQSTNTTQEQQVRLVGGTVWTIESQSVVCRNKSEGHSDSDVVGVDVV